MVHHHGWKEGDLEEGEGHAACPERARHAKHAVHAGPHTPLGPCLVLQGTSDCCQEAIRASSYFSKVKYYSLILLQAHCFRHWKA